jgi:hypothetical protein
VFHKQLQKWLLRLEDERLQHHFAHIEQHLRKTKIDHLSDELREARQRNIQWLHDYSAHGIFPRNSSFMQRPCFIDESDRVCAVAYLLLANEQTQAVKQITINDNYSYVPRMQSPLLKDWIETSGLTTQEVVKIQPSYIGEPTSLEFMQRLLQMNQFSEVVFGIFWILGCVSVVLCSFNLARLFRRHIDRKITVIGIVVALTLLGITLFAFQQLKDVSVIRGQICTNPRANCDTLSFRIPADLKQADQLLFNLEAVTIMGLVFTALILLPSSIQLLVHYRNRFQYRK